MASVKKAGGFLLGLERANLLRGVRPPQEARPLQGFRFFLIFGVGGLRFAFGKVAARQRLCPLGG